MLEEQVPQRTRRRFPKDPTPRFRQDVSRQLDSLRGCPDYQVPKDHLAREVWTLVERIDTSGLEAKFSALGRHGFHPRRVLAVLIYGSLIGLHESTKLGTALKTDAALQFLAGGQVISSGTLARDEWSLTVIETVERPGRPDLARCRRLRWHVGPRPRRS